ncbi:hypothetical protein F9C07_2630 [Aspergillus flavus]|uniref:Uncharacterized protein n=1 Tax=Aspergillus flavus (strain ATCC 200026 / FGSC A1120 / IAM 13836 / NRRL 3357 / JCM 12722 / SRRC 167) TaxID=332952 RepID=A0A7U2MET5_ASPFN|nr:hypothetical protein F9C07_2630 [Aspergillus flavus]
MESSGDGGEEKREGWKKFGVGDGGSNERGMLDVEPATLLTVRLTQSFACPTAPPQALIHHYRLRS